MSIKNVVPDFEKILVVFLYAAFCSHSTRSLLIFRSSSSSGFRCPFLENEFFGSSSVYYCQLYRSLFGTPFVSLTDTPPIHYYQPDRFFLNSGSYTLQPIVLFISLFILIIIKTPSPVVDNIRSE